MRVEVKGGLWAVATVCFYFLIFWVYFVDDSQTLPLIESMYLGVPPFRLVSLFF